MSNRSNVEAVLESVLQASLDSALAAKRSGNQEALMAYFHVLDVGLSMAREDGVFLNPRLAKIDPYELIDAGDSTNGNAIVEPGTADISSAQVALEEVMETAIEGLVGAQNRRDEAGVAAFYHILSVAKANAESLDVLFANDELNKLDPDAMLKGVKQAA